jgi:hypothetical protein
MLQPDLRSLGRFYRHTQPGTLMRWSLGVGSIVVAGVALLVLRAAPPFAAIVPLSVLVIFLIALTLFHSLSVEVTRSHLRLWFGPGLVRKSFAVSDIREVRTVRNHWYYGWGIRWTPHGWLFNVSGHDAVEIRLRNDRQYRIGTDRPGELCEAIRTACGDG